MKKALLVLSLISFCLTAFAQGDFMLEIKHDKKYIYVDKLNLPPSTPVSAVFASIPELSGMPGTSIYSNYEFKLDGVLLRGNAEASLVQIRLDDVEKIEIEESSSSSYQSNGQSGSVDVILKRPSERGVSGSASFYGGYKTNVEPGVKVNYKGEEFSLIALVNSSYQDYNNIREHYYRLSSEGAKTDDVTYDNTIISQFARVYIDYTPSKNNVWLFKVGQTYNQTDRRDEDYMIQPSLPTHYSYRYTAYNRSFTSDLYSRYKHYFKDESLLLAHIEYRYSNNKDENTIDAPLYRDQVDRIYNNTSVIFSKLEYEMHPATPLMLKIGTKYTYSFYKDDLYGFLNYIASSSSYILNDAVVNGKTNNVIPYFEFAWTKGYNFLKLCADYQYFNYNISEKGLITESQENNNFTGKIIGGVQLSKNKHLRLILSRNLSRPSYKQIFPAVNYDYSRDAFVRGNTELKPILLNQALLNYITNFRWDDHKLTINAGGGYIHSSDLIQTVVGQPIPVEGGDLTTYTYKNRGKSDIWNANLYGNYNYRGLSVCLSGNLFNNTLNIDGKKSNYNYYTVVLNPSLNFCEYWSAMCSLNFTSTAKVDGGEKSRNSMCYTAISRQIGSFTLSAWGYIPLIGEKKDITYGQYGNSERCYYTEFYGGGLGLRYSF